MWKWAQLWRIKDFPSMWYKCFPSKRCRAPVPAQWLMTLGKVVCGLEKEKSMEDVMKTLWQIVGAWSVLWIWLQTWKFSALFLFTTGPIYVWCEALSSLPQGSFINWALPDYISGDTALQSKRWSNLLDLILVWESSQSRAGPKW